MSTDPSPGALPPAESTLEVVDLMDDQGGGDGDGVDGDGEDADVAEEESSDTTSGGDKDFAVDTGNRKLVKNLRHYSYGLITSAAELGWEEEEIVRLIKLVTKQLSLTSEQVVHLLDVTKTGSPATLCCLLDESEGESAFTDTQLVSCLLSHAKNVHHFMNLVGEAFGCDLFHAGNANTLDVLFSFTNQNLGEGEIARFARMICEYSETKGNCGLVLSKFGAGLSSAQALGLVSSILSKDFFRDLSGKMNRFLEQLGPLRELAETLLDAKYRRDEGGELLESDQDSTGNLRGFVEDDEDDELEEAPLVEGADYAGAQMESGTGSSDDSGDEEGRSLGVSDSEENDEDEADEDDGGEGEGERRRPRAELEEGEEGESEDEMVIRKHKKRKAIEDEDDEGEDEEEEEEEGGGEDEGGQGGHAVGGSGEEDEDGDEYEDFADGV
ncbi:hypothetical protein B484DRAFT_448660 [Ochromonadaceae sp. CCMP2298]|nr:hypothetical protein B484DRAFT_448660 [Ochromonadaceae sp. CCMP2298]